LLCKNCVLLFLFVAGWLAPAAQAARYSVQSVIEKWALRSIAGLPATSVHIWPRDVAADGAGNLYVLTVSPTQVVRVGVDGIVRAVAGGGTAPLTSGARAVDLLLVNVQRLVADPAGVVYMTDETRHQIYRVGLDGILTIIAGTGARGFSGDGGLATAAQLARPRDLALDAAGNLYFVDLGNYRIRRIAKDTGVIQTVAGTGSSTASGDGGQALSAGMLPDHIGLDAAGNLYLTEYPDRIRRVAANGVISKIAGGGRSMSENVPLLEADLTVILGFAVASDGTLYVSLLSSESSQRVKLKTATPSGMVTTFAGGGGKGVTGDGGPPASATVSRPSAVVTSGGAVWFIDYHVVRRVSGGTIQTVAGSHSPAAMGEGGPLANAVLRHITALTSDAQGNYYFSDMFTHSVYKAPPDLSSITRIVGTGYPGYSGDSGPGRQMALNRPIDVEVDSSGNVYISDVWNSRICKLTPGGNVTTVAGAADDSSDTFSEGMSARRFYFEPTGLRADKTGNLYFVEVYGSVYRLAPGGTLHRFFADDSGFSYARAVDFDAAGNAYIVDGNGHRIRRVAVNGALTTFAGTGQAGFSGDGGQATAAALNMPSDVRVDAAGNVFFVDSGNNRVRRVTPAGVIDTIAGGGSGFQNQWEATAISATGVPEYYASLHLEAGGRLWFNEGIRVIRLDPAQLFLNWVYNCASFVTGPVAPGECFAFYGDAIGPASLVSATYSADGNLARNVSDTQVLVNGNAVPLIFVSKDFNAALMPYSISGTVKLEVQRPGGKTNSIDLTVAPSMPGLFTYTGGTGQIVAVNAENWTFNGAASAATRGQFMTIFLTGQGAVTPEVGDGVAVTGPTWPAPNTPVRIQVGGVEVPAGDIWAGLTYQGVLQVNFKVPDSAPTGNVTVLVTMGGAASQAGTTVNLK